MKFVHSIFKTFLLSVLMIAQVHFAYAQTASILPNAKTTFVDQNGKPLTGGKVDFYIPGGTTRKTTWQDAAQTVPNANPVVLDAAGRALILGSGSYRQVVKDSLGNLIWDQVTSSAGTGGSTSTATGDGDLVGTIKPWAGMTAPNQYLFTYGQEISRATYAALFTAITSTQGAFCNTGSPVLSGLGDTTNFWIGSSVEISCVAAGFSTVVSKTASTITLAANANVTVNTTAVFLPWGRGNGTTTFNLPDLRGFAIAGNNNMGGVASSRLTTAFFGATDPNSIGAAGGNQSTSVTLLTANLPPYTPAGSVSVASTDGINLASNGPADNFASIAGSGQWDNITRRQITSTGSLTGTAQGGTSTPIVASVVQPTKTANYIIKVTPDANSATASGVTSLGGMTGDIACGGGLLCTGNVISVNSITSGTPGGIPYFSTTGTQLSSGSLSSNNPILGASVGSPPTSGTRSGTTTVFGTTSGALTPGDCLKADANGNIIDSGAGCGANANTPHTQDFLAGTDFTAGTTTSLTLSSAPTSTDLLIVTFDGIWQNANTWSLSGAVVTFGAVIPLNTKVVEAKWSTSSTLAGVGSVSVGATTLNGAITLVPGPATSIAVSSQNITIGNNLSLVNALDYGAKCDGSTDDTTALQNGLNATPVGGTFYIPPSNFYDPTGHYIGGCVFSSTLTLNHPINISGGGMYSNLKPSVGFSTASPNIYIPQGGTYWEGMTFSNFSLGNDMTAEPYTRYGGKGIYLDAISMPRVRVINVFIGESSNDYSLVITGAGTQQDIIRDNKIYGGVLFNSIADSQIVEGNYFGGRSTFGLYLIMPGAGLLKFTGNTITAVGGVIISGVSAANVASNFWEELPGFPTNSTAISGRNCQLCIIGTSASAYIGPANIFNMGQSTNGNPLYLLSTATRASVVGNIFNNSSNSNIGSIWNTSTSLICGPNTFNQSVHIGGGGTTTNNYGAC